MLSQIAKRFVARAPMASRGFTHQTYVSGMPRVRIPMAEKVAHGCLIALLVWAGPCWVLLHISDYQGKTKAE